jgi:K+ transporter
VSEDSRFKVEVLGGGFYKLSISFGYMENPLLLPVLQNLAHTGQIPFKFQVNRNAFHEERRYGRPMQQVVEIGTQIYL